MKSLFLVLLSAVTTAWAYVPAATTRSFVPRVVVAAAAEHINGASASALLGSSSASSSSASTSSAVDFLKNLLESLSGPDGGKKLLEASSDKWKNAIYEAVGAPTTADPKIVAKALTDAMSRPENQFAILLGKAEDYVAVFPSDPVEYPGDGASFVECRLREKSNDELLVTMGVQVTQSPSDSSAWLISSIDWQDFRDKFYPGLSGREWLRAF